MKKKILAAMLAACVLTAIPAGIGTSNPLGGGIVQTASAYGGAWWPGSGWWPSDDWWDDDDDDCWDDDDDDCWDDDDDDHNQAQVTSITLDRTSINETFEYGEGITGTAYLTATVETKGHGNVGKVKWSSSDSDVASVSGYGKLAAVNFNGVGTATITAKCGNKTATCKVTISRKEKPQVEVTSVEVYPDRIDKEFYAGNISGGEQLYAAVYTNKWHHDSDQKVTWRSSDKSVATVSQNGYVTFKSFGEATITATAGGKSDTCTVTIKEKQKPAYVKKVTVNPDSITEEFKFDEEVTGSEHLTATVHMSDGSTSEKDVKWSSSNESVATVDRNGKVTFVGFGTARITASVGKVSDTCTVTINVEQSQIGPISVRYVVEHYKADGYKYTLVDTEYLTGEIGETVAADPKDYEGFVYNASLSNASGTLKEISEPDDIVTLRLYYDVEEVEEKELDFSELLAAIEKGEAKFDDGCTYTEETLKALKYALNEAGYVYNSKDPDTLTQDDIDEAADAVIIALKNLKLASEQPPVEEEVDKSKLASAIEMADAVKALDSYKDYTDESKKVFEEALEVAKEVMDDLDATQDEVDDAAAALVDATNGLTTEQPPVEEEKVDKSALADAIDKANAYINAPGYEDKYTEDSRDYLLKVYNESKAVYEDENATQEEVDAAAAALEKAVNDLKEISDLPQGLDFSALKDAIARAEGIISADGYEDTYTEESRKALDEILSAAKKLLTEDTYQAQINWTVEDLNKAIDNLKLVSQLPVGVNKQKLTLALGNADKAMDEGGYTAESLANLKKVYDEAWAVWDNDNATQAEVDFATEKLNAAINALVPVSVDKSALEKLIGNVKDKFSSGDYTIASMQKVYPFLKEAMDVLNDKDATQAEVNKAYNDLYDSLIMLVKKDNCSEKPDQDQGCIDSIEDLIDEILDMIHRGEFDKDDAEYIIEIINRYFGYGHWYDQDELDHLLYWLWCQMDHAVVVRPSYTVSAPAQTLDGWKYYNSGTLYYNDGIRTRGFAVIDGDTYYFDRQGFMQTGWVWVSDDDHEGWWYFDEDGRMVTGWLKIGNVWYYLDTVSGRMYDNGLAQIGGVTYYFFNWGGMANDWWYQASDGWYFFQGNGAMQRSGWRLWKGSYYYLTASGLMATNTTTPDGYYVNANGVWVK